MSQIKIEDRGKKMTSPPVVHFPKSLWRQAVLRVTHKTTLYDDAIGKVLPLARDNFNGRDSFVVALANASHHAEGFCSINILKRVLEAIGRGWDELVVKETACVFIVYGSTCLIELVNNAKLPLIKTRVLFCDIKEVVEEAKRINEKAAQDRETALGEYTHMGGGEISSSDEDEEMKETEEARKKEKAEKKKKAKEMKEKESQQKKIDAEVQGNVLPINDKISFLITQAVIITTLFVIALFKPNK